MNDMIERLEGRRLLAGDVSVVRGDGVIRLIASADTTAPVRIERVNATSIRVVGDGVTIDGATSRRLKLGSERLVMDFTRAESTNVTLSGLRMTRGVTLSAVDGALMLEDCVVGALNAGDGNGAETTLVTLADSTVSGDAGLRFFSGASELLMTNVTIGGKLLLDGKGGASNVSIVNSTVRGETKLATGAARDTFTLESSRFRKSVGISAGAGNDALLFDRSTFAGKLAINDGAGRDAIQTKLAYDYSLSDGGWTPGFADYAGDELEDPVRTWGNLPAGVDGKGWTLGVTNRADDTIMYLTRPVGRREGVVDGLDFVIEYDVQFASNAPSGSPGIGGSVGDSVYVKVGASAEPLSTSGEKNRLNIDVGAQSEGGTSATVIGTIGNGRDALDPVEYVELQRKGVHAYPVAAGADGTVHLFVGTDSGYEGRTVLAYRSVAVTLRSVR